MAAKKVTTGRILEVLASGRSSLRGRDERVVVRVHVDPTCPRDVALAVKEALVPQRSGTIVEVRGLEASAPEGEGPDVVIVLVGSRPCAQLVESYARAGVRVGMVVEGALDAPRLDLPEQAEPLVGVIASEDPSALPDRLAAWLAASCDKPLAIAAGLPFCRRAVADALVARCAAENAVVGAISLIPGSDFPVMCANQAKLALDLAAAYGRDVEPARALELGGVVAGGLLWRGVARCPGVGAWLWGPPQGGHRLRGHARDRQRAAPALRARGPAARGAPGKDAPRARRLSRPSFRRARRRRLRHHWR